MSELTFSVSSVSASPRSFRRQSIRSPIESTENKINQTHTFLYGIMSMYLLTYSFLLHTWTDSHYIRYTAASVLKRPIGNVCMEGEVLRIVPHCLILR